MSYFRGSPSFESIYIYIYSVDDRIREKTEISPGDQKSITFYDVDEKPVEI
ncbi:MAG: hypothetical protein HRT68_11580 [Flavobacteriaceae bacterium]|nr:hypothetical protein [Flavobacteriaceae bacterium]